jgi:hypothetical protein
MPTMPSPIPSPVADPGGEASSTEGPSLITNVTNEIREDELPHSLNTSQANYFMPGATFAKAEVI